MLTLEQGVLAFANTYMCKVCVKFKDFTCKVHTSNEKLT